MMVSDAAKIENSILIQPVQISDGVTIVNSVVGPYVSIGKNTRVLNARLTNSIVRSESFIQNAVIENSLVGMHSSVDLKALDLSMGDFSTMN
jgi:glucose-1-phosphate thymidylyltransferase